MTRVAAVALALVSTAAAWTLVVAAEFEVVVAAGTLALASGLAVLAQALPRTVRFAVAVAALSALPATAAWRMKQLADAARPFSTRYPFPRDLVEQTLPVVSGGEPRGPERFMVYLDRQGRLIWKAKNISLAELDEILDHATAGPGGLVPVLVCADKETPIQHLGWLMLAVRAHGREETRVLAAWSADALSTDPESAALAAGSREGYWPELEVVLPAAADDEGVRLRISVEESSRQTPGPRGARYELGGRTTDDLRELARWMRDMPPRRIEADPAVQLKFVVAVEDRIRSEGLPPAALALQDPPGESIRNATPLPFPSAD